MIIRLIFLLARLFSFGAVFESCTAAKPPGASSGSGSGEDDDDDDYGDDDDDFSGPTVRKIYYDPDIKEMMEDKCDECHANGAASDDPLMESYLETKENADKILEQLESGDMPKGSSLRLFDDESWGDDDDDDSVVVGDDDDDDDDDDGFMTDAEMVESWIDAGMPKSADDLGDNEKDPFLFPAAYDACHADGKMYNPSTKECDETATYPPSFSCDSTVALKDDLSGTYGVLFTGSGEVEGIDALIADGYDKIFDCGEVGGKPVIWLYKTDGDSYNFKKRFVQ